MQILYLTKGQVALLDDTDLPVIAPFTWCASRAGNTYYACGYCGTGRDDNRVVYMHRLLVQPRPGYEVHHWDGDGLNNQRSNLREVTRSQHLHLNSRPNRTGYRGVCWQSNRFLAQINCGGEHFYLGRYQTVEEAAQAYDTKAIELFGEFARTNFPQPPTNHDQHQPI
jgi:hypothetical protein